MALSCSETEQRDPEGRMILGRIDKYGILCFGGVLGRRPGSLLGLHDGDKNTLEVKLTQSLKRLGIA
jgi:hypothetical protein